MKYPALDVRGVDPDLLLAVADDFSPSAVDERHDMVTIFFTSDQHRVSAAKAIAEAWPSASIARRDVDDGDWARRSQEGLTPITVGRVTVAPPWCVRERPSRTPPIALDPDELRRRPLERQGREGGQPLVLVITPSMGFGTGHHATTRLCLSALQRLDLLDQLVLDVGTGSGVLALAARLLGAREAIGLDSDSDALQAAEENLAANREIDHVRFLVGDLRLVALPVADVVTANLTGTLLAQSASVLLQAVRPGGTLILSGLLSTERAGVLSAFAEGTALAWEAEEEGWLGLTLSACGQNEV